MSVAEIVVSSRRLNINGVKTARRVGQGASAWGSMPVVDLILDLRIERSGMKDSPASSIIS